MNAKSGEELSELSRAEDILLGAMGFADDAKLTKVIINGSDLILEGFYQSDKESFSVKYDCDRGEIEDWAIVVLQKSGIVESR